MDHLWRSCTTVTKYRPRHKPPPTTREFRIPQTTRMAFGPLADIPAMYHSTAEKAPPPRKERYQNRARAHLAQHGIEWGDEEDLPTSRIGALTIG